MNAVTFQPARLQPPAARPAQRTALLIMGMHRSGTSAITRSINLLGAGLAGDLLPPAPSNETGFWEARALVALHDEIFAAAGTNWHGVTAIPARFFRSQRAARFVDALTRFIDREFAGSDLFAVKDPRLSRLLPLWITALDRLGIAPRAVLMLRSPDEVVHSLHKRDRIGSARSYALWLRYSLDALQHARSMPHCIVRYDDLLGDWRTTLDRAGSRLGIAWPDRQNPVAISAVDAFLRTDLKHHAPDRSSDSRKGVAAWAVALHAALEQAAIQGTLPKPHPVEDYVRERFATWSATWGMAFRAASATRRVLATALPAARTAAAPENGYRLHRVHRAVSARIRDQLRTAYLLLLASRDDRLSLPVRVLTGLCALYFLSPLSIVPRPAPIDRIAAHNLARLIAPSILSEHRGTARITIC